MIDPNVPKPDHAPSRSTVLDLALQIGLAGSFALRLRPVHIAFWQPPDLVCNSGGDAVSAASAPGRPARQSLVGAADRAGRRRGDAGGDGHGGDVDCVFPVFADRGFAQSKPERPAAAAMACRPPAGGPEADGGLGARRHQHAGGVCQIPRDVERAGGMARVVGRWPGRRATVVRSLFRDRRRHRRLRQGRRRFRSATARTFYRQRGAGGPSGCR